MKLFIYLLLFANFSFAGTNFSDTTLPQPTIAQDTLLPKVFLIGEYEAQFEDLMSSHSTLLLSACDNDMKIAFQKWQSMLQAMEKHSEAVNYNLKGVKIWLNVFWDEDGSIEHIAYYLKPNSRNVDTDELTLFFIDFINSYRFPLVVGEKFSHYGMASFPTYTQAKTKQDKSDGTPLVKDSMKAPDDHEE